MLVVNGSEMCEGSRRGRLARPTLLRTRSWIAVVHIAAVVQPTSDQSSQGVACPCLPVLLRIDSSITSTFIHTGPRQRELALGSQLPAAPRPSSTLHVPSPYVAKMLGRRSAPSGPSISPDGLYACLLGRLLPGIIFSRAKRPTSFETRCSARLRGGRRLGSFHLGDATSRV